jgi:DNA replication protein DnaC
MARLCGDFARAFKANETPRWIALLGKSGTGKTHCGRRLWNHLSARLSWQSCQFVHGETYWPNFVSRLRSGNSYDLLQDMVNWPVLFLDDICSERDTTGFSSEQLNMLLGSRENKWTIITGNITLSDIAKLDARIADRMIRKPNLFIELNTKSYSLRDKENV